MKRRGFLWGLLAAPAVAIVPSVVSGAVTRSTEPCNSFGVPMSQISALLADAQLVAYIMPANAVRHPLLLESQISYQRGVGELLPKRRRLGK